MILAVSVALVMVDLTSLILPEEDLFPFSSSFCKTETILINNDFENTHPKTICFQNLKVSSVKLSQPLASYCSLLLPKLGQVPVNSFARDYVSMNMLMKIGKAKNLSESWVPSRLY